MFEYHSPPSPNPEIHMQMSINGVGFPLSTRLHNINAVSPTGKKRNFTDSINEVETGLLILYILVYWYNNKQRTRYILY